MASGLRFELTIEPNPRMVSVVRRFVEEAFEKLVSDPDAVFRIAMAAHELLENAAKYAVGGRATLRVVMQDGDGRAAAHISLSNATTPAHIERLRARVAEVAGSAHPLALYQDLMRRSSHDRDESGLGLARIRAEGEMSLGLEVTGDEVTVLASAVVDRRGA